MGGSNPEIFGKSSEGDIYDQIYEKLTLGCYPLFKDRKKGDSS
jgi:hypothetical protein